MEATGYVRASAAHRAPVVHRFPVKPAARRRPESVTTRTQRWLESADTLRETRLTYGICAFAFLYLSVKVLQSLLQGLLF
ncbi:hypothetical protein GTO89_14970 [Heliobacterium gestii]|uniref:Uncharacterized protein n=1 Tax=Heliomicrobium gestii TaxID=2699 RepID=A0A845LIW0_HELGE|nr:hypothetical protein [Heliomicrobium gestii]MBM7868139.1 hypothetical protein [Heliomicrobium gestii]MZP44335.1 hypothetical protein [Heliomicrobium gestii]